MLFILIASFLSFELYLRITQEPQVTPGYIRTHPIRGYELRPNFKGKTYNANFQTNSYGLRDEERPISRGNETYRIVILGDSITMGIGVELQDTFPKVLERKFKDSYKTSVQVFNLGVSSYNTISEYLYLLESYDKFLPHLVIFEFTSVNDTVIDRHFLEGRRGMNGNFFLGMVKDYLRYLYSYQWLAEKYYLVRYNLKYGLFFNKHPEVHLNARSCEEEQYYQDGYPGWLKTQGTFKKIAQFCQDKNIFLIFVIHANNVKLSPFLESDRAYAIIKKVTMSLRNSGIKHILILDELFRKYSGRESMLWVRANDSHFSPLAHQLVGEVLYQYILENKFLQAK